MAVVSTRSLAGATAEQGLLLGLACVLLGGVGAAASALPLPTCSGGVLAGLHTNGSGGGSRGGLGAKLGLPLRTALLIGLGLTTLGAFLLQDQVRGVRAVRVMAGWGCGGSGKQQEWGRSRRGARGGWLTCPAGGSRGCVCVCALFRARMHAWCP